MELFGLLEKGELMEGPKLSSLIAKMHKSENYVQFRGIVQSHEFHYN